MPGIEQPADLHGKVLAVSSPGSSSDTILRKALSANGLDPDSDVTIVSAGRMPERLAALESGQVAGTLFTLAQIDNAKKAGYHVLLDMNDLDMPFQHTAIVTTRSFLADNQETVTNFLKAMIAARAAMIRDPQNGPDIIADGLIIESEQERNNIRSIYSIVTEDYMVRVPIPTQEGLTELLAQARQEAPNSRDITAGDIVDLAIIQELQDSGFIDALYEPADQE
jgi:NitT/TauT family transport system substrate-binding protein